MLPRLSLYIYLCTYSVQSQKERWWVEVYEIYYCDSCWQWLCVVLAYWRAGFHIPCPNSVWTPAALCLWACKKLAFLLWGKHSVFKKYKKPFSGIGLRMCHHGHFFLGLLVSLSGRVICLSLLAGCSGESHDQPGLERVWSPHGSRCPCFPIKVPPHPQKENALSQVASGSPHCPE